MSVIIFLISRGGVVVTRGSHKPEIGGSNPPPATNGSVAQWWSDGIISQRLVVRVHPEPPKKYYQCDQRVKICG